VTQAWAQSGGGGAGTGMAGAASQQIFAPGVRNIRDIGQDLHFTYYMSFLGPSPGLGWGETYNVFRDSFGNSPYQMLHVGNLSYALNPRWTIGMTLAGVNDISKKVQNGTRTDFGPTASPADNTEVPNYTRNEREWFNARIYIITPNANFDFGYLTTNFAFELPTSEDAKDDKLKYGVVLTNNLGLYSPNPKWSYGFTSQIIYYLYDDPEFLPFQGATIPVRYQTMLVTVGPYVNYSLSDSYQIASKIAVDWDKQGNQKIAEFNNNLPHWGRLALNRLFRDSALMQVGVYSQFMLEEASAKRTVFGFDLTARF